MRNTRLISTLLAGLVAGMAAGAFAFDGPAGDAVPPPPAIRPVPVASDDSRGAVPLPEPAPIPDRDIHSQSAPAPQVAPIAPAPQEAAGPVPPNGQSPCCQSPCCPPTCMVGCGCHEVDCYEAPYGASFRAAACAQICNGMRARMVLYQYDFCDPAACDGYKLSPKGAARLTDIARMLPATNFHPILIEATAGNPQLDAARRAYVLRALGQMSIPVPDQLVVVGEPRATALNGQEAFLLHLNLLRQAQQGGAQLANGNATFAAGNGTPQNSNNNSNQGR